MSTSNPLQLPTPQHQEAVAIIQAYFADLPEVDTLLLVNSCARGQATPQSDLDFAVLIDPQTPSDRRKALESGWESFSRSDPILMAFRQGGRFRAVHLDLIDGQYLPAVWDDGGGPDTFELEIGNQVAYSLPLGPAGPEFAHLQAGWLPYYDESLRLQRLNMVREACIYDLDFVPFYVGRGLYFQAFDRVYKAFQEFLQAFFIAQRRYPLAYNKWIREQIAVQMGLEDLYHQCTALLVLVDFEGAEIAQKAEALRQLVAAWC